MLDQETKRRINSLRDILVGNVTNPISQVDQITNALIYKFMDDMDRENEEVGLKPQYFAGKYEKYAWKNLMSVKISSRERFDLYEEALAKMSLNENIPELFKNIFLNASRLPYNDPKVLTLFLKEISWFNYDNSENLGNAFEYLLSILGSQGDAGMFRTPRHIIDFIVEVVDPKKNESILDPACGTAGFLISAYKHILKKNSSSFKPEEEKAEDKIVQGESVAETVIQEKKNYTGDLLSLDDRVRITKNIVGYDISPDMVKLALVNLYLHKFPDPQIYKYNTLGDDKRWGEQFNVILANPPFMTPKGGISPHKRFSVQVNKAEALFVDYIAEHLSIKGRAGIIVPEGIIFANVYKNLRKNLVENWGLYAVVSLPSGVFNPYAGVKTSILLLDKEIAKRSKEILFLKVENDGFDLGAKRRKIDKNDLPEILEIINEWKQKQKIENNVSGILLENGENLLSEDEGRMLLENQKYVAIAKEKIAKNGDYNLTGDRYRETVDYSNAKWPMVELGEVCELVRGITYKKDDEVKDNGLKVLRANNIDLDSSLNLQDVKQILKNLKLKDDKKLKKDDIFICLASGSKKHIGKVVFIESDTDYYFGGFMGVIRISKKEKALSQYIFQQLKSYKFNDFLRKEISGVNINNLNSKILSRYQIPLPPLEVQEQIVAEIEQYQKVIIGAKQVAENWKPSFRIDPSWEMVELGEVCDTTSGGTPLKSKNEYYENGTIPWLRSGEVAQGEVYKSELFITEQGLKNSSAKLFPKNTVLVAMYGATAGQVGLLKFESTTNQAICGILPNDKFMPEFLYQILKSQKDIMIRLAGGGAQPNISQTIIKTLKIPIPPIEVQEKIVAEIEAEQKIVNANRELMEKMEKKIEKKISEVWGDC